ncbi:hypothetical protein A6A04_02210 [Paramagnetospirillum marisnigri]|uniref:Uncharacterized protein n=1 Tax=Paramagnetospirillum marisnigri TaxID=1285242 RepID=A0A178MP53_9PROT|nr:hypothetical protein A6A04_02210 [Paramagnetospirillum marisnigri]
MKRLSVITVCLLATACAENTEGQIFGTVAGAGTGAAIGRAAAIGSRAPLGFTGVGAAAGAVLGYAIGDYVDPQAQRLWSGATVEAAETGRAVRWESHGHRGSVTALGESWTDAGARVCRNLRQEASRLREADTPYMRQVVACRNAEGSWEVAEPAKDDEI